MHCIVEFENYSFRRTRAINRYLQRENTFGKKLYDVQNYVYCSNNGLDFKSDHTFKMKYSVLTQCEGLSIKVNLKFSPCLYNAFKRSKRCLFCPC